MPAAGTSPPSGATGSGLGNYTIEYPSKPNRTDDRQESLTVTANNESRTYGADDSGVTFGYSITGFVKGDVLDSSEVSGSLNYTHTDGTDPPTEAKQPVGNYAISISPTHCDPLTYTDTNYTLDSSLLRSRHADDHAGPLDHHGRATRARPTALRRHGTAPRWAHRLHHYLRTALNNGDMSPR